MNINQIRRKGAEFGLDDWSVLSITGKDREKFINGQVTSDIASLEIATGQWSTRINLNGKIKNYFQLIKLKDQLIILIKSKYLDELFSDFSNFIIMEDVEINILETLLGVFIGPEYKNFAKKLKNNYAFSNMLGQPAVFFWDINRKDINGSIKDVELLSILSGESRWDYDVENKTFLNNSTLNEVGVSYTKGCFYGQEIVAKIENNRGAAYYPVLLEIQKENSLSNFSEAVEFRVNGKKAGQLFQKINYDDNEYISATLIRDYRVNRKILKIELDGLKINIVVRYLPLFKENTPELRSLYLFDEAIKEFHYDKYKQAIELLKTSISINPKNFDAYEIWGVILGRQKKYSEGIDVMDLLLDVDPSSVMAHTNKSLFLMNLGKIEEAEEEKSKATVKTFSKFGEQADLKKIEEAEKEKIKKENESRKHMFNQVLKIDPNDPIANYGMADILFFEKNYHEALGNVEKSIEGNQKYSVAYLLNGKIYEALGEIQKAKEVYEMGINIASKVGDIMPANSMQERLSNLL